MEQIEGTGEGQDIPAREVMVAMTKGEEGEEMVRPKIKEQVQGIAPQEPNAYSDGSLKNTKGYFWQLGGAGVWWPNRVESEVTQEEMKIAEYKETEGGVMLWCSFNASLNSSTRCELAAAIIAMLAPRPVHIGIHNQTAVGKGTEIIQHERRRQEEDRHGKMVQ